MTSLQINNLASEIVIAKNASASATNKVTTLLTEVYSLKTSNITTNDKLNELVNNINDITNIINNNYFDTSSSTSNTLTDLSFNNLIDIINNLDLSYQNSFKTNNLEVFNNSIFHHCVDISGHLNVKGNYVIDSSSINQYGFIEISNISHVLDNNIIITNISNDISLNNESLSILSTDVSLVKLDLSTIRSDFESSFNAIVNTNNNLKSTIDNFNKNDNVLEISINSIDSSINSIIHDINNVNSNLSIMTTHEYLFKNDIIYSNTLIDNNNISIINLQNKFINLVKLLNDKYNFNINQNLL